MMIKKTNIISGLVYIEIPEANLYIQCGAPAESVKHLKKNNIIKPTSKNDVPFETGPNAILLSDSMIQNGEFSNMSEFSVLQMLYMQGMILPNHPNNVGLKPILIGSKKQVTSQIQYIYRGNYGLVSQKEIEDCGIKSDKAKELMNMKLKFAFGKLQDANDLLKSCILENGKKEIRDEVFIQRKEYNIFVISYKGQSVEVDLNLAKNQTYPSTYTLPQSKIQREHFSIVHTGQGDGWDINKPSMNSIISFAGKLYIVDAVPNLKYILNSLSIDINQIEGVFQTHTHDDHLAGITSLLRSDKKIKFFASKLVLSATAKKLSALLNFDESEFYNLVDAHELKIDEWNDIDGLEVATYLSPHPVETTIFVFRTLYKDMYKTYGHFADIVSIDILKGMIVQNKEDIGILQEFYDEVVKNYNQTLDLKKVDIGGGMIHGNTKDFANDKTKKIILSHTFKELTEEEKKIGLGVPFGYKDILISSDVNYDLDLITSYLKSNFSHISDAQRKVFLDFNIIDFAPKQIIINEMQDIQNVYLIVSGEVELIKKDQSKIVLKSGIIIGEKTALTKELPTGKYIAKNFTRLLEIPIDFFYDFVNKNHLIESMIDKNIKRLFLQKTHLFEDAITYSTLNKIIEELDEIDVTKDTFVAQNNKLYIIVSGKVDVKMHETVLETLSKGDHFGGASAILSYPSPYSFEVTDGTILFSIPESILKDIPIVRWKILERLEVQIQELLDMLI